MNKKSIVGWVEAKPKPNNSIVLLLLVGLSKAQPNLDLIFRRLMAYSICLMIFGVGSNFIREIVIPVKAGMTALTPKTVGQRLYRHHESVFRFLRRSIA